GPNFPPGAGGTQAAYNAALPGQLNSLRSGQLYPYLKAEKVYLCPADKTDLLYYQRNVYVTSYVWNGSVCGFGKYQINNVTASYKITQFKPDAILQWETDEKTPFFFNDASSFPDEGISARHGKGATVGLFSGSTFSVVLKNWYGIGLAGTQGQRGAGIPA